MSYEFQTMSRIRQQNLRFLQKLLCEQMQL
jgi:hypothetical protein